MTKKSKAGDKHVKKVKKKAQRVLSDLAVLANLAGYLPAGPSPLSRLTLETDPAAAARRELWLKKHEKRMREEWPAERKRLLAGAQRERLLAALAPVDAIFSPIKKVRYLVTNARVGQRTDLGAVEAGDLCCNALHPGDEGIGRRCRRVVVEDGVAKRADATAARGKHDVGAAQRERGRGRRVGACRRGDLADDDRRRRVGGRLRHGQGIHGRIHARVGHRDGDRVDDAARQRDGDRLDEELDEHRAAGRADGKLTDAKLDKANRIWIVQARSGSCKRSTKSTTCAPRRPPCARPAGVWH